MNPHDDDLAGDVLLGASTIRSFLMRLGMTKANPYYLRRSGWPIGNTADGAPAGGILIASKRQLIGHIGKMTRGGGVSDRPQRPDDQLDLFVE
jgi:hypothetical protein